MRSASTAFLCLPLLLTSFAACGGASSSLFGASDGGGSAGPDGGSGASDEGGASTTTRDAGSGAGYQIHVRATQTPVTFTDGYSGETPIDQRFGVRSLTLLRNANDPSPLLVFDNGANVVDTPVNAGSDTIVGYASAGSLPAATFTIAQVVVGYYDFTVAATLHDNSVATQGDYHDVEVLADGVNYHGQSYSKGYYSFTWEIGGTAYGTVTGQDLITPVDLTSGGLTLVASGSAATYVFPVNVTLDPTLPTTTKIVMTVNTYENFRWQDESEPGYLPGVFDTTPTSYEPVESFGANSFTITLQ
ncbi:MAG: hypothetical protein ACLQVI_15245 [Polyangiaceae bacterium]